MKKISQILLTIMLSLALAIPAMAETVNINKADQEALQYYLHGIGKVKAKAIVDYRRKHGRFKSINDLLNVPGVGEATLQKIRRNISLSSGVTQAPKNIGGKRSKSLSKNKKKATKTTSKARSSRSNKTKNTKNKSKSVKKKTKKTKSSKNSKKAKDTTNKKKSSTKKKRSKKSRK